MAVTSIKRDWGVEPAIVRMTSTDALATVAAAGYLTDEDANIQLANNGEWQWLASDMVAVYASDGWGLYTIASDYTGLNPLTATGGISNVLPSAQVLVGNASNVAAAVAMSGDVAIDNAGATTIQAGAVDLSMLAAGVAPSHVVKFAGKVNDGGGSSTIVLPVVGSLATDVAMAQIEASTDFVSVEKVTPGADTVTVQLSSDPGAATVVSYQVLRASV